MMNLTRKSENNAENPVFRLCPVPPAAALPREDVRPAVPENLRDISVYDLTFAPFGLIVGAVQSFFHQPFEIRSVET